MKPEHPVPTSMVSDSQPIFLYLQPSPHHLPTHILDYLKANCRHEKSNFMLYTLKGAFKRETHNHILSSLWLWLVTLMQAALFSRGRLKSKGQPRALGWRAGLSPGHLGKLVDLKPAQNTPSPQSLAGS